MRVAVFRFTTLVDVKEGIIDRGELPTPETDALRLILGEEMQPSEFDALVTTANRFTRVRVVLSRSCHWAWSMMSRFKSLWGVQVYGLTKGSVGDLREIPDTIKDIEVGIESGIGEVVDELRRFSGLQRLSFSGKLKGVESLTEFPEVSELHLHYVSEIDLNELRAPKKLRDLKIHHGSIAELPHSNPFPRLKRLNIWKTKGLNSVDWISKLKELEELEFGALPQIAEIPDLSALASLESVIVDQMKGLSRVSAFASAPALRTLHIKSMNQIEIMDYGAFKGHPTLLALTSGYSGRKKNAQVRDLLGKPEIEYEVFANTREF